MKVREVMKKNVELIAKDKSISDAARIMRDDGVGSLPVSYNDKIVGMITDRDITINVVAEGKRPDSTKVEECMSEHIKYCYDDEELDDVMLQMNKLHVRRLPVMNRDKRLVGIISKGDLSSKTSRGAAA